MRTYYRGVFNMLGVLAISATLQACNADNPLGPSTEEPPLPPPPPATAVLHLEIDGREVTLHDAGVYTLEVGDSLIAWGISAYRHPDTASLSSLIRGYPLAAGSFQTGDAEAGADGWMAMGSAEVLCVFATDREHRGELVIESVQNGRVRGHFRVVMLGEHVEDGAPGDCGTTEVVCESFDLPLNPPYLDESLTYEQPR